MFFKFVYKNPCKNNKLILRFASQKGPATRAEHCNFHEVIFTHTIMKLFLLTQLNYVSASLNAHNKKR